MILQTICFTDSITKGNVYIVVLLNEIMKLNKNDYNLLAFCLNRPHSISEIARGIDIAPKNVSVRISKLKNAKLIDVEKKGKGKETLIRTKKGIKTKKYVKKYLIKLQKEGGCMPEKDFEFFIDSSLDFSSADSLEKSEIHDKITAKYLLFKNNLVERQISLTSKGKEFLNQE